MRPPELRQRLAWRATRNDRELQAQKLNVVQAIKTAPTVAELAVELKRSAAVLLHAYVARARSVGVPIGRVAIPFAA